MSKQAEIEFSQLHEDWMKMFHITVSKENAS